MNYAISHMTMYKKIDGHKDYSISETGNVRNDLTGKILKATLHGRSDRKNIVHYLRIELKNPRKKYLVHRLVAKAFIPNPNNYDQVNHIDKNPLNNHINNLEWCNTKQNCIHGQGKRVLQYDKKGNKLGDYKSLGEAAEATNSSFQLISKVCLGERITHNNFIWKYI